MSDSSHSGTVNLGSPYSIQNGRIHRRSQLLFPYSNFFPLKKFFLVAPRFVMAHRIVAGCPSLGTCQSPGHAPEGSLFRCQTQLQSSGPCEPAPELRSRAVPELDAGFCGRVIRNPCAPGGTVGGKGSCRTGCPPASSDK